jgi:hypothetical protein
MATIIKQKKIKSGYLTLERFNETELGTGYLVGIYKHQWSSHALFSKVFRQLKDAEDYYRSLKVK